MPTIIRIDDTLVRSLIMDRTLWEDFPRFETLNTKYTNSKDKPCNCRRSTATNKGAQILNEAKLYIQGQTREKKEILKKHLKADYIKIGTVDVTGRHDDRTF